MRPHKIQYILVIMYMYVVGNEVIIEGWYHGLRNASLSYLVTMNQAHGALEGASTVHADVIFMYSLYTLYLHSYFSVLLRNHCCHMYISVSVKKCSEVARKVVFVYQALI